MQKMVEGDCLEVLRKLPANSVDSIVTDPPYGLSSPPLGLELVRILLAWILDKPLLRKGKGFMGQAWDASVPGPEVWRECLRVLRPGGHILCFAGSRTVDLMGISLRLAGFEIRDQLQWIYGSGFPKSLDVSKAIDKLEGIDRTDIHRSTTISETPNSASHRGTHICNTCGKYYGSAAANCKCPKSKPVGANARRFDGYGTALKPAHEPIIVARKPLIGTVAANVLAHGTGGINVGGCGIPRCAGDASGWSVTGSSESENTAMSGKNYARAARPDARDRWPANVVMDKQAGAMLDEQAGNPPKRPSRFFYCPKANRTEREAGLEDFEPQRRSDGRKKDTDNPRLRTAPRRNTHPTVKPIALMQWLVRLVTPPSGLVLDPFAGSGTTGIACMREGFRFLGIEMDGEYVEIARARIAAGESADLSRLGARVRAHRETNQTSLAQRLGFEEV